MPNKTIPFVLYVPGLTKNLLSVGRLTDGDRLVVFSSKGCFVVNCFNTKHVYLRGYHNPKDRLYHLSNSRGLPLPQKPPELLQFVNLTEDASTATSGQLDVILTPTAAVTSTETDLSDSKDLVSLAEKLTEPEVSKLDTTDLWHRRLNHLSYQTAHHRASKGFVKGIPSLQVGKDQNCKTSVLSKHHRAKKQKRSARLTTRPLKLVHTDLCNPITGGKFKYLLTFTDDCTHYTWVQFLQLKSETLLHFKRFVALAENLHPHKVTNVFFSERDWSPKVAQLCSDRGGKYLSQEFKSYCLQRGIHRQLTNAYSPHQNGVSERKKLNSVGSCQVHISL
jgi:hypothetical protein